MWWAYDEAMAEAEWDRCYKNKEIKPCEENGQWVISVRDFTRYVGAQGTKKTTGIERHSQHELVLKRTEEIMQRGLRASQFAADQFRAHGSDALMEGRASTGQHVGDQTSMATSWLSEDWFEQAWLNAT